MKELTEGHHQEWISTGPPGPGSLAIQDNCSNRMGPEPTVLRSDFCPINFRWYGSGLPWLGFDSGEGA